MMKLLLRLLGIGPVVVPVLVERGHMRGVMSPEEQLAMRRRWAEVLKGRAQDDRVRAIVELIEMRTLQAQAQVQFVQNHAGNAQVVSYHAGGAAQLNDLLADLVRCLNGKAPGVQE